MHAPKIPKTQKTLSKYSYPLPASTTFLFYLISVLNFLSANLTFLTVHNLKTPFWSASQLSLPKVGVRRALTWRKDLTPVTRYSKIGVKSTLTQPLFRLFSIFLRLSLSSNSFFLNPHHTARLLFNLNTRTKLAALNSTTLFHRWKNFYDLFTNIIVLNFKTFFLGNRYLWGEIVSNNWLNFRKKKTLRWTLLSSFFFCDHSPNLFSGLTFDRLVELAPDFIFLLDLQAHKTHLFFLKPTPIFLIGLVPINLNPWQLDYPIPIFSANLLVQYYFLKLHFLLVRIFRNLNYLSAKQMWTSVNY